MYVAMNRFGVVTGREEAVRGRLAKPEDAARRDAGLRVFHLLRGPAGADNLLSAAPTVRESEARFVARTRPEALPAAQRDAGSTRDLHLDHPQFAGFAAVEGA